MTTIPLPAPTYSYAAVVLNIIDADTVKVALRLHKAPRGWPDQDWGFHVYLEKGWVTLHAPIRFLGQNSDEASTPGGQAATAFLRTLLAVGDKVTVRSTTPARQVQPDKYGTRYLGVIEKGTLNINAALLASGLAVSWDGRGPKPVPPYPPIPVTITAPPLGLP